MQWKGRRQSANVEDRRGRGPGLAIGGGLGGILLLLLALFSGVDLGGIGTDAPLAGDAAYAASPQEEELRAFVSVVLADTEDVWRELLGQGYREPTLVLFTGAVQSACGFQGAATGPFYCPLDENVYIDLSFYNELQERFGARGDFAQAYVIAHEVGHHVQNLLGTMEDVHERQARAGQAEANRFSVALELQADFYAGVWAHHARRQNLLDPGDIEEALAAASAIGDDRLQMQAQGTVTPESFTHGTSAQRLEWFRRGLESGDWRRGDTFGARPQ